jgi:hypothetical protein
MAEALLEHWLSCMRAGRFADAWRIADASVAARRGADCSHLPRHLQHLWNGEPLDGKRVLIRCYHGLGDTIQFVRYAPMVKAVAAEVIVWAQPRLIPLLGSARGIDRLLPLHDGEPGAACDADVEIMELAHVFRSTPETLPRDVPYLFARAAHLPGSSSFRVGIAWRSGDWDPSRAVPFDLVTGIASTPGVSAYALQHRLEPAEHDPRLILPDQRETPHGTASLMRALDLVISVDSMPAHLAGALGVPTWTLLRREGDWRWMDDRDDSPWYPTMRLMRQEREGDWSGVTARVLDEVRALAAKSI